MGDITIPTGTSDLNTLLTADQKAFIDANKSNDLNFEIIVEAITGDCKYVKSKVSQYASSPIDASLGGTIKEGEKQIFRVYGLNQLYFYSVDGTTVIRTVIF